MTWHIVSQICWSICNLEPLRPSAALNATELARPWAIPSRPARPAIPRRCCPFPSPSWQHGRSEPRKRSTARAKAPSRWPPERRTWGTWKAGKDGIRGTRRCHEISWKATWNIMKHLVESASELCPFCPLTQLNHAKSLWLFGPGAAGVAGLSKAAWSSSCSSPSPDPTQCRWIGCDCHRSCRVNEHKCQHCYGSASAALKVWIKQKTELAHWQIKYWNILNKSLNKFMWTVNLNFHYSNIFTDSPWITWFLCLWGWTTTLIWLDFLLPFPQRSLIGGRMQEERLCPLSASVEPTDMPRPQSFPAKSWISVNFLLSLFMSIVQKQVYMMCDGCTVPYNGWLI